MWARSRAFRPTTRTSARLAGRPGGHIDVDGPTVGRQIHEGDILYVNIPEKHARIVELELKPKLMRMSGRSENFPKYQEKEGPFWGR